MENLTLISFIYLFICLFINLLIYLWLCWVFVAVGGLPLVAESGSLIAVASLVEHGL